MRSYFRDALLADPTPDAAYPCPHCGAMHNVADAVNDEAPQKPEPGSVMICEDCGELGQFVSVDPMVLQAITIADVPAEARDEARAAMEKVQSVRPGHIPAAYRRVVAALDRALLAHLREAPPPLFAIPEQGVRIAADLGDMGEQFARNDSAREFLAKAVTPEMTGRQGPTLFMLAAVLEGRGIPVERISMAEMRAMGAIIMAVQPGGAGEA